MSKRATYIDHSNLWPDTYLNAGQQNNSGLTPEHYDFEQQYLALRNKENRIYSDDELEKLPAIDKNHPHYKEWRIRKKSFLTLKNYLENKKRSLEILEAGCGNGWLSNQLSLHLNCRVTGVDVNRPELEQAVRVFDRNTECTFITGEIRSGLLAGNKYDIIIFAASLQYFSSLKEILYVTRKLLKAGGEIHIIDTHFYKEQEIKPAQQRSKLHFDSLGFPDMSAMYFHHSFKELKNFNPVILYDPFSFRNRFFRRQSPFYRICIRKD